EARHSILTVKRAISSDRRISPVLVVLLLPVVSAAVPAVAGIIPAGRTAPWQGNVGVPGGIPNRTKIYKNIVKDLGADPTGAKDCSAIIQRAINECPKNQVVYIPAGRFRMESQVHWTKSNVTTRGAGMGVTTLYPANNNNLILPGSATWPPPSTLVPITAGATKGSSTITVADAT